jgi:DNA-binding NarL/FixJ family response regulator
MKKRIVLFDEDPVYGAILEKKLSSCESFVYLGWCRSADQLKQRLKKEKPDILLLELTSNMKPEFIGNIRVNHPTINVVMLSGKEDGDSIIQALKAGANGYLIKSLDSQEIVDDLTRFDQRGVALSLSVARTLVRRFWVTPNSPLTKTETRVLKLVSLGHSRSEIAGQLNISVETVRSHMKNIYKKLNVHRRSEMVRKAMSEHLID